MKQKMIDLANESVNLIWKFENNTKEIFRQSLIKDVEIIFDDNSNVYYIKVEKEYEERTNYYLSEISEVFDEYYIYNEGFQEWVNIEISELNKSELGVNGYLRRQGEIYILQAECNEIYDRLKEIANETSQLFIKECS